MRQVTHSEVGASIPQGISKVLSKSSSTKARAMARTDKSRENAISKDASYEV